MTSQAEQPSETAATGTLTVSPPTPPTATSVSSSHSRVVLVKSGCLHWQTQGGISTTAENSVKSLADLSHTVMMATAIIKVLVWGQEGPGWEMLGRGLVSPVRVETALLADLEDSEKECKLSLVPRTWRLVARPEELFHSQSRKDHTSTLRP